MIEERLLELIRAALETAADELGIDGERPEPELLPTKQKEHGDFASNVALVLASRAGRKPREVAEAIRAAFPEAPFVERVEVAGPGFLNIFVTDGWLYDALRDVVAAGASYGAGARNGKRVQVEFLSSNPTGPLTIGHAATPPSETHWRRCSSTRVGMSNASTTSTTPVDRWIGSAGRSRRGCSSCSAATSGCPMTDTGATTWRRSPRDPGGGRSGDRRSPRRRAVRSSSGSWRRRILAGIKATLPRFGVRFDVYRSERDLAEAGEIEDAIRRLRGAGFIYDAEGAVWFRSTAFGDDKDRVVIKSNGVHTYFAADCAYLIDKFGRGFDHVIYVWGADHHGDVVRVKGAAQALGFDPDAVEIVLYQFVAFLRDGVPVKMSTRAGEFVTLDALIDEVGTDAARFTLLQFSNDSAVNFDIEVVKQQTMENPVYYVQYGHARIASILRKAESQGIALKAIVDVDLSVLTHDSELDLLRALAEVPGKLATAAEQRAPHRLTHASQDLAAKFHRFYTECRVVSDDEALTQARLWLATGTKQVIANLLGLLGVSAPEVMDRVDG